MNSSSERIVTEIRNLLDSFNEHNYGSVTNQLSQYIDYGTEESVLLAETCLDRFTTYKEDLQNTHLGPAICTLFRKLMEKPHFSLVFSSLVRHTSVSKEFLDNLSCALQLSGCEKLGFGLALLDSENNDVRMAGRNFCMSRCEELCAVHNSLNTAEYIQNVLRFLEKSEVLSKHVDSFMQMILQVSSTVLLLLLNDASMTGIVLKLWHVNPSLFSKALNDALNLYPENMYRAVDLFQELEILLLILDRVPMSLRIRLAAVASQKKFIDLEEWLSTSLSTYKQIFFEECLKFQKEVKKNSGKIWKVFMETIPIFSKVLHLHCSPKIDNIGDPDPLASELYEDHIKTEADFYFQKMFGGQLTVGEMVQMLKQFKESSEKRDQKVFECMISNMSEVYKFSNKYPNEEIEIAALLFGLLIRHQLVNHSTLDVALQAVLDALREPADSRIFGFGTKAKEYFEDHLIKCPEYCQKRLQNSHLLGTCSDENSVIEQTLARTLRGTSIPPANIEPQNVLRPSVAMDSSPDCSVPSQAVTSARFGSALNIRTLLAAADSRQTPIETPPSETQDIISSIINNLSAVNIEAKEKDFTAILAERYYPWFAQYLVMQRASVQPDFHMLYINFLERTSSKPLNKEIVKASYENCKVLLSSELIKSSMEERQLLKNLGGWLGKLTIGRNKALLAKLIDPKSLVLEAYENGLMIGVIPFTIKILELCRSSVAYQPPNVWTMAILGLLAEIYATENLKNTLKHEIEVLFINLEVDITEITPTSLLKDRVRIIEGNLDFSPPKIVKEVNSTVRSAVNQVQFPPAAAGPFYQGGLTSYQRDSPRPETFYPNICAQDICVDWEQLHPPEYCNWYLLQQLPFRRNLRDGARPETFYPNLPAQGTICAPWEPLNSEYGHLSRPQQRVDKDSDWHHSRQHGYIWPDVHSYPSIRGSGPGQLNSHVFSSGLRNSPGSKLVTSITIKPPLLTTGAALDKFLILSKKLQNLIANNAKEAEIQRVIAEVLEIIPRCKSKDEVVLTVARKVFESLYENEASTTHVDARLAILAAICDVSKLVRKELTSWVLHSGDDDKFNKDITVGLIRRQLLNLTEYNFHMAKLIDARKSDNPAKFAISLVETLETSDAKVISELQNVVDALAKVTNHPEDRRRAKSSEPDFHEQVSILLAEWYQIRVRSGGYDAAACADYVLQLHQNILSKDDDTPDSFFCILLELAVSHYPSSEGNNLGPLQFQQEEDSSSFLLIDIFVDLVFSILKFYPNDHGTSKLFLLLKVLAVIVRFITKDAEEKKTSFCPRPYVRLFINFFVHFGILYSVINDANYKVLKAISESLHALQPVKVPAFSFAWLELVSHKCFMPKLLLEDDQKGWQYFHCLLVDFLQFMEPLLSTGELTEPVRVLYKGTLRVLLLLIHDFPEFLCYYHFSLCDVISPHCVQMRNIVLSAFPRNISIPDPKTPNLKVDLLPEMSQPPYISSNVDAVLEANKMKSDVDEYLNTRPKESSFLSQLKNKLLLPSSEAERSGTCYNVPLMNSLVLYVGTKAIQQLQATTTPRETSVGSCAGAALNIFHTLILDLDSEGRYYFFNAVANQLRYPNNHTRYFAFIIFYFFTEIKQESVQEQITRILLERMITKSPHPWGALVTFLEFVKNPRYNFSKLKFTKCDPEIERVFDSVLRTCSRLIPTGNSGASEGGPR